MQDTNYFKRDFPKADASSINYMHEVMIFDKNSAIMNEKNPLVTSCLQQPEAKFIFNDKNYQDVAIEMSAKITKGVFDIEQEGVYEFFCIASEVEPPYSEIESIIIDNQIVLKTEKLEVKNKRVKYQKLGEIIFAEGQHKLILKYSRRRIQDKTIKNPKVSLWVTNKIARQKKAKEFFQQITDCNNNLGYFFTKDSAEFWVN